MLAVVEEGGKRERGMGRIEGSDQPTGGVGCG